MTTLNARTSAVVVIGIGLTLFGAFSQVNLLNDRAPVARAILETATVIVGTMVAFLVLGRYRRSRSNADLLIVFAVLLLAWVHPLFVGIPDLISPHSVGNGLSERFELWGTNVVRIVATMYLVLATITRGRWSSLTGGARNLWFISYAPVACGLVTILLLVWFVPVSYGGLLHVHRWPQSALSYLQLLGALNFLVAFWRLSKESERQSDPFISWLADGCLLGTFAMISYALFQIRGVEWIQPGDVLRALVLFTWAAGVVTEIRSYWSKIAESAKSDSRRSVALDLHDGIAQELALITSYLQVPASERANPDWHSELLSTAERALAETRRTITALAKGELAPIEADLKDATLLASGGNVKVRVEVELTSMITETEIDQRESIIRIVREAVSNAVRHGHANQVDVIFDEAGGSPALRIVDDGVGFDPLVTAGSDRFGLTSMRERAKVMGATLQVQSTPGQGTTVEVLWP
jgi:signal transduction histidine kinase